MSTECKPVLPLRALLEFEGWSISSREPRPGQVELVAVNSMSRQRHSIVAGSEDQALTDLARRVGWKDVD